MANITNLQMWKDICADTRIGISKSLFGLRTKATYTTTGSAVYARTLEYAANDGNRLRQIITNGEGTLDKAIGDFHPTPTVNGNFMAEVCSSEDGEFAAVLLTQFHDMGYEPVTDTIVYEGKNAQMIKQLFSN